ncbi:MAG: tRNA pseudouridine(38-40) synthase TruA [Alphaproteobacteria bacterium]|nr:tRNA pseudouridine(38-40) synthase TruA [Alphaproteobacteria bacterium]
MNRYKITIEYDGTNYAGWQKQKNAKTIQGEIEKALGTFSQEICIIHGMGRTDSGVHALGQVAHFDLKKEWDTEIISKGLNYYLKEHPIVILNCEKVKESFHARHSAKERFYQYVVLNRFAYPAIEKNRVWHVNQKLNISKMRSAAKLLLGTHDFSSFRTTLCEAKSPIRTLNRLDIKTNGDRILFELSAPSFLHHMVRNIVGTLQMVGIGKFTEKDFLDYFNKKDVSIIKYTAPASGLYFKKVSY